MSETFISESDENVRIALAHSLDFAMYSIFQRYKIVEENTNDRFQLYYVDFSSSHQIDFFVSHGALLLSM